MVNEPPRYSRRRKVGALVSFLDLPAVQVWVAAASLGLAFAVQSARVPYLTVFLSLVAMSCLFMYLMAINDYFDSEIDKEKHQFSALVTGALSKGRAAIAIVVTCLIGLGASLFVSSWFLIFSLLIFCDSTLYSAPPVRMKEVFPVSTISELVGGYLLLPLGASVASLPNPQVFAISFVPFLVAASLRLAHELKYVDFDRSTGKDTLAVVLGTRTLTKVVLVLPIIATILTLAFLFQGIISLPFTVLTLSFIFLPLIVRAVIRSDAALRPISYVWGFVFFVAAVFIVQ